MSDDALKISGLAMAYDKQRMEWAANNIAHANSLQNANHPTYLPVHVQRVPNADFKAILQNQAEPLQKVYAPENPAADKEGFIYYPNVNKVDEMVTMKSAQIDYEANIKAINIEKKMMSQSLTIGDKN